MSKQILETERLILREMTGQLARHYRGMEMPHLVFSVRRERVETSTRK